MLSRQWTTKALIRLRTSARWSGPPLFAYGINRFFMAWHVWHFNRFALSELICIFQGRHIRKEFPPSYSEIFMFKCVDRQAMDHWWYVSIRLRSTILAVVLDFNLCFVLTTSLVCGPCRAILVLIAYASSEGSGEPAHPRNLARTFAAHSYKQWVKRNLQTESQITGPSEWLGMRS